MNATIAHVLKNLSFGEPQAFQNIEAVPVFGFPSVGSEYISLGEAMARKALTVSEVSEGGSVPEIEVINSADVAILLLDGEELLGAKQNRVINSTVLLKPISTTVVDVSCTERGRWAYDSRKFRDSDIVMERKIRARKNRSIAASLKNERTHRSDQGGIWAEIDALRGNAGVNSGTDAMRDVYLHRQADTEECLASLGIADGQVGLAVLVNDAVVGMDLVSRPDVYQSLHQKLILSYAIDSIRETENSGRDNAREKVSAFLASIAVCRESSHDSAGYGTDLRYEASHLTGSALVHGEECVHAAFFSS